MGIVYRAFDPVVQRPVAIKTIRWSDAFCPEPIERLKREARAVGSLEHPNIVGLYDAGEQGGMFYLVMQLVQGETLQARMDRQQRFAPSEILELFRQLLAALEYAHSRGVVHRDVKPANIIITRDGLLKLADFGIAKLAGPGISVTGALIGTPSFMSPEQVLGQAIDARSDIFSLGCVLYNLVAGEKPFRGDSSTAIMYKIAHEEAPSPGLSFPGIDPQLEAMIAKALEKDPSRRFQSCAGFRNALEVCFTPRAPDLIKEKETIDGASAPRRTGSHRTWRWLRLWIGAFLGAALATLISSTLIPKAALMSVRTAPLAEPESRPPESITVSPPVAPQPPAARSTTVRPSGGPTLPRRFSPPLAALPSLPALRKPPPQPSEPDTFRAVVIRGDIAYQQNRYHDALAEYQKAYGMNPQDISLRRKLAVVWTLLGDPETARRYSLDKR